MPATVNVHVSALGIVAAQDLLAGPHVVGQVDRHHAGGERDHDRDGHGERAQTWSSVGHRGGALRGRILVVLVTRVRGRVEGRSQRVGHLPIPSVGEPGRWSPRTCVRRTT